VRRLVVVDIAPVAYSDAREGGASSSAWRDVAAVVAAAHALDPSGFRSRQDVEAALAARVADAGVRAFVCQNLVAQPGGGYRWRMNGAALLASLPHFASFPDAEALRAEREAAGASATAPPPAGAEVHFVSGERSGYVRERHHDRIRALFPAAVLHTPVVGAGHWVHADAPTEFWRILSGILRLREGAASA
jgi:pimeloyl-ACP methyl ester carboxylesterase